MAWSYAVNRMARLKVVKSFDVQVGEELSSLALESDFEQWLWVKPLRGPKDVKHFPCEMGDQFDSQPIAFRVNFREL